jgi:hypothetical protein
MLGCKSGTDERVRSTLIEQHVAGCWFTKNASAVIISPVGMDSTVV